MDIWSPHATWLVDLWVLFEGPFAIIGDLAFGMMASQQDANTAYAAIMNLLDTVSICIPVFNGERFLRAAIDSALAQTYENIEVIIVDDYSSDDSYQIALGFAANDTRVKLFRNNRNFGLVGNWNECIRRANGAWIKFLFQDDLLDASCVELLLRAAASPMHFYPIAFCQRRYLFESDVNKQTRSNYANRLAQSRSCLEEGLISPARLAQLALEWPAWNIFGEPPSFLIRRDLFDRVGLFDARFGHICDLEFWVRAGLHSGIHYLPDTLVSFRVHSGATTNYNKTVKAFRTRYIERTVLFGKYCNGADYEPLRHLLAQHGVGSRLNTQLAIFARRARLRAESGDDPVWAAELEAVYGQYPEVRSAARISFLILGLRYAHEASKIWFWSMKRRLRMHKWSFRVIQ